MMVVTLLFKKKLPALASEVHSRCEQLKNYGVVLHKVEVYLDGSPSGFYARVNLRGPSLRLNASERRFTHPGQAVHYALQKIETQLARISSKKSKKRPLLAKRAKLIQLNSSLEFEPHRRVTRRRLKAA